MSDQLWFTAAEAAERLRFKSLNAFRVWRHRHPQALASYKRGGTLLFARRDLDQLPQRVFQPSAASAQQASRDRHVSTQPDQLVSHVAPLAQSQATDSHLSRKHHSIVNGGVR